MFRPTWTCPDNATMYAILGRELSAKILRKEMDLLCLIFYADNFLPSILYIVVVPEDGHIGRNMNLWKEK